MEFSSQHTGVSSLFLLQGILPTQRSNPGLPHCRGIRYQLSHQGSLRTLEWEACPSSSGLFSNYNHFGENFKTLTASPLTPLEGPRPLLPIFSPQSCSHLAGESSGSQEDQLCTALVNQLNKFADKETLVQFLRCFLLESNSSSVRWQAHCLTLHIYR